MSTSKATTMNRFYETVGLIDIDEPLYIWYQFTEFETYLFESKLRNGLPQSSVVKDLEKMPVKQYVHEITQWVNDVMDQS